MTPFEFKTIIDVKQAQQKAEAEKDLLSAYLMAYFQRIDKLEPFETYRSRLDQTEPQKKQMTDEEMLAKVMHLNNLMTGDSS